LSSISELTCHKYIVTNLEHEKKSRRHLSRIPTHTGRYKHWLLFNIRIRSSLTNLQLVDFFLLLLRQVLIVNWVSRKSKRSNSIVFIRTINKRVHVFNQEMNTSQDIIIVYDIRSIYLFSFLIETSIIVRRMIAAFVELAIVHFLHTEIKKMIPHINTIWHVTYCCSSRLPLFCEHFAYIFFLLHFC
jgi:hypothetical protein